MRPWSRTLVLKATLAATLVMTSLAGPRVFTAPAALANYGLTTGWATFGLTLPSGVATSGVQVGSLPTQTDVKTRWSDGSIRYAIVSAQVPANGTYPISAAPQATGTFAPTWPSAMTHLVINGQDWVATLPAASPDVWLSGPNVMESRQWATPMLNGQPHPSLRVLYDVRSYRTGGNRVDVTVENGLNIAATNKVTYDTTIVVNGVQVFTYANAAHGSFSRWRKVFPTAGVVESDVTPDFTPFQQAKAIPTYMPDMVSSTWPTPSPAFDILHLGNLTYPIGTTGGRPEIGPYPTWTAQYLVFKTASQKTSMLRHGDNAAGAWSIHYRESDNSMVTVDKKPIFWTNRNPCGCDGINGPANNLAGMTYPIEAGAAHHGSLAYVPYLVTGDRYYLDEMQFWANAAVESWDWARNGAQGLISSQNARAVGWGLRNLVDVATSMPDTDPYKSYFVNIVNNNLVAIDKRAQSLADLNGLGAVWIGDQYADEIPIWQHAYLAWAITHAQRSGFTAGGMWTRDMMAKFQLALFTHYPAYDRNYAGPYFLKVTQSTTSPGVYVPFADFGALFQANFNCATCPAQPLFPGAYGPEARMLLLMAVDQGWPGAQGALNFLMTWSDPQRGTVLADLQKRGQFYFDPSSIQVGVATTSGAPRPPSLVRVH